MTLTSTEFLLLYALASRPGVVKSRDALMEAVYDDPTHVQPESAQYLYAVHARHLDIEDGQVGRLVLNTINCRGPIGVSRDAMTFGLKCN